MENFAPFSAESWEYAGQMTLLGMGMVFAVLGALWLVLTVFKLVFVGKPANNENKPKKQADVPKPVEKKTAPVAAQPTDQAAAQDDAVIAAIITAAVAAYMAEQGVSEDGFRVVSFKRAGTGRAWNSSNR